jgi:hypothetical protein
MVDWWLVEVETANSFSGSSRSGRAGQGRDPPIDVGSIRVGGSKPNGRTQSGMSSAKPTFAGEHLERRLPDSSVKVAGLTSMREGREEPIGCRGRHAKGHR